MNKIKFLSLIAITILFFGCGSKTNKETKKAELVENLTDQQAPSETEIKTTKANFIMMIANTAGTSFIFKTSETDDLQLFPDENLQGMEFAYGLQPGETNHKYKEKTFEIKYEKRAIKTTGGDIVDRFFLLEIKDISTLAPKPEKFSWFFGMCNYTGTYDANKYTEEQLKNTLDYLIHGKGTLKLFSIFTPDDLKRIKERDIEQEYNKILKELKSIEFVNTRYFNEIKQKQIKHVERMKTLSLLEIKSYSDPKVLLNDPYTKEHCTEYTNALIAGGDALLDMRKKMAEESRDSGNNAAWPKYIEESESSNKLELARIYVSTFGWWNCVNNGIEYLDEYELHESGFLSLFNDITKECEEP